MRTKFVNTLAELAREDDRIFLLTADMGYSVFESFQKEFPDRFINVGVAEQNAVGIASGLAQSGNIVYVYSIIPFVTMRCFEQVRLDLAYNRSNVKLVGVGAGFTYGPQGTSHHAIEDIAIMRAIPNMTVLCPGDPIETRELIRRSYEVYGPMYIRLGKSGEPNIHSENLQISIGESIHVTEGEDLILITTSTMLETGKRWVEEWREEGIKVHLISMPTLKPFDVKTIKNIIELDQPVITLEEHNVIGGLGSAVAEVIAESGKSVKFMRLGIQDSFVTIVGNHNFIKEKIGLVAKPKLPWQIRK